MEATRGGASPARRGGALALLAATLFGLSTPLVQRFGLGLGPFSTAALLYADAALVALFQRRGAGPKRRSDVPRLLAMVTAGAVVGPVALAWGLQHTRRQRLAAAHARSRVHRRAGLALVRRCAVRTGQDCRGAAPLVASGWATNAATCTAGRFSTWRSQTLPSSVF